VSLAATPDSDRISRDWVSSDINPNAATTACTRGFLQAHPSSISPVELPIVISTDDGHYTPEVSQGMFRAVIGVAAFAGLREGEIRGQWWEDDDGDVLNIRRSMWRTHLNDETKTHEDDDDPRVVPIIEPLRDVLDSIKPEIASGWMFPNTIGGALDLDNLADRVIKPVFKANGLKWKGWHAYHRGSPRICTDSECQTR
jgi:integrase